VQRAAGCEADESPETFRSEQLPQIHPAAPPLFRQHLNTCAVQTALSSAFTFQDPLLATNTNEARRSAQRSQRSQRNGAMHEITNEIFSQPMPCSAAIHRTPRT
jgi:hypothetical protein